MRRTNKIVKFYLGNRYNKSRRHWCHPGEIPRLHNKWLYKTTNHGHKKVSLAFQHRDWCIIILLKWWWKQFQASWMIRTLMWVSHKEAIRLKESINPLITDTHKSLWMLEKRDHNQEMPLHNHNWERKNSNFQWSLSTIMH